MPRTLQKVGRGPVNTRIRPSGLLFISSSVWPFPLYLTNEAKQIAGHGKSFPAPCDFKGLGHSSRRLILENIWLERDLILRKAKSHHPEHQTRKQGWWLTVTRRMCLTQPGEALQTLSAHESSCFCLGGGGGLSLVTCLHSLQPCAQSEHTVVLSPTAVVCGSVSGHSALSVISVFRALMCNRL